MRKRKFRKSIPAAFMMTAIIVGTLGSTTAHASAPNWKAIGRTYEKKYEALGKDYEDKYEALGKDYESTYKKVANDWETWAKSLANQFRR